MMNYDKAIEKYAELLVKVGINVQPKEGLIVVSNQWGLPLAREVIRKAYEAGAKHVEYMMGDDEMVIARYQSAKDYVFENFPEWKVELMIKLYEDNYHHLFIIAPDPELLKQIPSDKVAIDQKTASAAMSPATKFRMTGQTKWCIAAVPSEAWAKSVYPERSTEEAIDGLWGKILDATRVSLDNPVEAWQEHDKMLKKYKNFLNEKQFDKLVLKAPGTELEIGLADEHFWMGGSKESWAKDAFVANIPTEEVFTTPHKFRVNGTVKSTKPLSHNGKIVDGFGFTFKEGKVVDYYAEKGKEVLDQLLANDEGASYLGEVALVQDDSPISNTGILFNNTLFDENASVHLALGRAYAYAMRNGSSLSQEELEARGANFSLIHVDFMIGGPEMEIIAYSKDGEATPLFEQGNWTF
ncbi:MAG: aminopeptidase [Clostridiales bacterium 38-18]|nr:MAG: aminopeptidase [Clostridiales bacterium 38-18]